jgi:hypothetical protein
MDVVDGEFPDAELLKIPKISLHLSSHSPPIQSLVHDGKLVPYLGGRIPLAWIERAAKLPGKAFHLGVLLWHLHRLQRSVSTSVKLEPKWYPQVRASSEYRGAGVGPVSARGADYAGSGAWGSGRGDACGPGAVA